MKLRIWFSWIVGYWNYVFFLNIINPELKSSIKHSEFHLQRTTNQKNGLPWSGTAHHSGGAVSSTKRFGSAPGTARNNGRQRTDELDGQLFALCNSFALGKTDGIHGEENICCLRSGFHFFPVCNLKFHRTAPQREARKFSSSTTRNLAREQRWKILK